MRPVLILVTAALSALFLLPQSATAQIQVDVSGNGADTTNNVSVDSTQTTSTTQSNSADISNSVSSNATTGDNSTNNNTGSDVGIATGDVEQSTNVVNQVNNSQVTTPCCEDSLNLTVTGNGENSVNTIHTNVSTTTVINVTQVATVNNNISLSANTGNNRVSNNYGNVEVKTGNINVQGNLANVINQTQLTVGAGAWDITVIAKNNGVDSTNIIFLDFLNDLLLWKNDIANINNNIYADLNTGGNTAFNNIGNVFIKTGNIDFSFDVINGPINSNLAEVFCCEDGQPVTPPSDGEQPTPQPGVPPSPSQANGGNGNGKNGGVGGDKVGQILGALAQALPVTGARAIHFWMMAVVYLLTFLLGLYLRLRAGRSPDMRPHRL